MSDLPDNNGSEAAVWMERARTQAATASFLAGRRNWSEACHHLVRMAEMAIKSVYIDHEVPVPRSHNIYALLADCPAARIREQVTKVLDKDKLDEFLSYYIALYPEGEDADQDIYLRFKRMADLVMRRVEEALA
ncbi:MAG: HEPN domain-containing protein [Acidimicrobiia bacterium]|nr:HEPN domain-containing protein [Acidimicrobiia bacterium]